MGGKIKARLPTAALTKYYRMLAKRLTLRVRCAAGGWLGGWAGKKKTRPVCNPATSPLKNVVLAHLV